MATPKPRVYLDATCYVDVAKGRLGAATKPGEEARDEQVVYIEALLLAALNGDIEIIASTLIIAECLYVENKENIPDEAKAAFLSLLESGNPVTLLAPDPFIAERARDLLWINGISCGRSADQIHVATALHAACEEFVTTNKKQGPLRETVATKLEKLGLRAVRPQHTLVLPAQYIPAPLFAAAAKATPGPSSDSGQPSEQSRGDGPMKAAQPEPDRPVAPQGAQGQPQLGSSASVAPPARPTE